MTRAVEMNRSDPESWYSLGRLRYTEQRYTDALDCFTRALVLAPRSVKVENNLGLAYEGLNRPDDAVAAYRQAIAWQNAAPSTPRQRTTLLNLAIALIHRGEVLGQALPPFPQYDFIQGDCCLENLDHSSYDAMVVSLERRVRNGFNLQASYTWSKTLTDADSTIPFNYVSGKTLERDPAHGGRSPGWVCGVPG